jgi:phosphoglycerate dehydrogenase-like enzyme
MQILFLNPLNEYWKKQLPALEAEFPGVKFIKDFDSNKRSELIRIADAVISGKLTADDLDNGPNLKAVFVPFTGLDNFPVHEILQKNIYLSHTHANAKYVAEKAVSLALALLGRIVEFHKDLYNGIWHLFQLNPSNYWTTIQGKTCAILGYGEIGRHIVKFLKPYDCKIIAFKKNISEEAPYADEITTDLNFAIEKSDLVFLALPLTEATKGIINKEALDKMKDKYIINIGRGTLIDEEALYKALKTKTLAGAAIDVWYNYPGRSKPEPVFPSKFPFHELDNIVLSPHKAGLTKESIESMIDDTINNIRSFLKTGIPANIVKDHY